MEKAAYARAEYYITYRKALSIWMDTHYLVEENGDLLEIAAEQLYKDKVLGPEFWEEEILLRRKF